MRRALAVLAILAGATAARAQDATYFDPAGSVAPSPFVFSWDALVRYDSIQLANQGPPGTPDFYRWRSEVRPEIDWKPSDRFRIGVRGLGELSSDSNRTNDLRLDNYRSNTAALDRYFVEAKPGNFTILGGQFEMPFRTTEMLWDHDLQVLGGAASYRQTLSENLALTAAAGFFYGPQRENDQSHIAAGQATLSVGSADSIRLDWSESYWHFTHLSSTAYHFLRQNNGEVGGYSGGLTYLARFLILDSLVRVKIPAGRFPITVSADWAHNFGATESDYRDGVELALRVGSVGNPWDVEFFDIYQYVDRDAVVGAYNTDDWWFHTWYTGHRVGAGVTVLPSIEVRPSIVFQRRLDRTSYLQRYLVDLVKVF